MLNKLLKIGIVCPYSWDTPGGVGNHIRDLGRVFDSSGTQRFGFGTSIRRCNVALIRC
jgi:hypothetical protein